MLPFALLLPAAMAPVAPYPLDAVLNEMRAACSIDGNLAAYKRHLTARGWKPALIVPNSWMAGWSANLRKLESDTFHVTYLYYSRVVAGRTLNAYVSEVYQPADEYTPGHGLTCQVYDFAAASGITTAATVKWAKVESLRSPFDESDGIVLRRWVPGLTPGAEDTSIHFIPPDDPAKKKKQGLNYTVNFTLPDR